MIYENNTEIINVLIEIAKQLYEDEFEDFIISIADHTFSGEFETVRPDDVFIEGLRLGASNNDVHIITELPIAWDDEGFIEKPKNKNEIDKIADQVDVIDDEEDIVGESIDGSFIFVGTAEAVIKKLRSEASKLIGRRDER